MSFVELAAPPADCVGAAAPARSLAARLWRGEHAPTERLLRRAEEVHARLSGAIGRVESGGRFEDAGLGEELKAALPPVFAAATRSLMEWYGCAGAFFHNDAHYDGVLFGVWSVVGPARELVFPRAGLRLPAAPGNIVIFDPFEPHAVLEPGAVRYCGEDYEGAQSNLFLGFEIELVPAVCSLFAVGPAKGYGVTLSSRIAINPETGALARPG